jgi:hypothetical protein
MATKTNVDKLRDAGVLPTWVTLTPAQTDAINNKLSGPEVDTLLDIHQRVGPIDVGLPTARILIF